MAILYTIPKGAHYANGVRTSFLVGNTVLAFKAKFYPNCIYEDPQTPGQINKLYGIAYGRHHNCSARIGWRSDGKRIEVLAYVYVAPQKVESKHLAWVDVQEWHSFRITRKRKQLWVSIDDQTPLEFELRSPSPFGYRLSPYFGGQLPAPQEMMIEIEITRLNGLGA